MSGTTEEVVLEQGGVDAEPNEQLHQEIPEQETKHADKNEEHQMPSQQQQEETIKKKYGGILPKKKPLISKDHEHAFFDSADWALGKGGHKPKGPLEALRPKLQPTPHHQARSRRPAYARADGEDGPRMSNEDHDSAGEDDKHEKGNSEDQS